MRLIELVFDYLMVPLGMILGGLLCGLWWQWYENVAQGLILGAFSLLTLYAGVYEMGYKKYLKQQEMRSYYYLVFVTPVFLATVSFIYGVLKYVLYWI